MTKDKYEAEINRLFATLSNQETYSKEYVDTLRHIQTIQTLKKENKPFIKKISPELVYTSLFNLATVLVILNYEKADIISTRATTFVKSLSFKK